MAVSTKVSRSSVCLLLAGSLGIAGTQSAGCSTPFHSCYETRTCPPKAEEDGGAAGADGDATGGVRSDAGGSSGRKGGASAGTGDPGGSGESGGGVETSPGGASATAGASGSSAGDSGDAGASSCSTARDRACTAQCPCASAEGVCTASEQCLSGANCVAGSGKKVGRTGDTCLADHCNNDKLDAGETSVDCGGECGCRATFEVVSLKNMPSGTENSTFQTMSRDGRRLAGSIGRGQSSYPAAFEYDGTVTELESYGKGGQVVAASSDGNVLIGSLLCTNPPACTASGSARWVGSSPPMVLDVVGALRASSSSGTIVAGDTGESASNGFIFSAQRTLIPELSYVHAMTPDGKYVAGRLQDPNKSGLWSVQTALVTNIGASNWTYTWITAANGTDPVVVGYGYISASKSNVGFRWKAGVMTDLGLLPNGTSTTATAVSFDGATVVGQSGSDSFQNAFIWTESDKLRSILDELKGRGLEPPIDLQITNPQFISDDGKTIVGSLNSTPSTFWRVHLQ